MAVHRALVRNDDERCESNGEIQSMSMITVKSITVKGWGYIARLNEIVLKQDLYSAR